MEAPRQPGDTESNLSRAKSFSSPWVWKVVPWFLLILAAAGTVRAVGETDLFFHIAMGDYFRETGVTTGNPEWTFAPTDAPWTNTMLLPEIFFSYVYGWLGWTGLAVLQSIISVSVALSLWFGFGAVVDSSLSKKSPITSQAASVATVLAFLALSPSLTPRPQSFALIFLVLLGVWTVRIVREGYMPTWWTVGLITCGWAWIHGTAMLVAPLLLAAFVIRYVVFRSETRTRYLLDALLVVSVSTFATMLTPAGPNIWTSAIKIREAASPYITEWMPLAFDNPPAWTIGILAFSWLIFALPNTKTELWRLTAAEGALLIVLTLAASTSARMGVIFLPVIACLVVARAASRFANNSGKLWEQWDDEKTFTKIRVGSAAIVIATISMSAATATLDTAMVPSKIWSGIEQEEGPRRVLKTHNLGSQPYFFGGDKVSTYMDSPVDKYGIAIFDRVQNFMQTPDLELSLLDEYDITDVVIDVTSPKVEVLEGMGWTVKDSSEKYLWLTKN